MKSINKSSLSARRAWIEIATSLLVYLALIVALRKESVDRNTPPKVQALAVGRSLSARRAWIEIGLDWRAPRYAPRSLSARRAWIENYIIKITETPLRRRSPQGERG